MTKTDEDYEAEYQKERELRQKDVEGRIAANAAIEDANRLSAKANEELILFNRETQGQRVIAANHLALQIKTEIERQVMECESWLAAYEAQKPIVQQTKVTLINFMTNDPNAQIKRLLALSNIEEWFAREDAHAKVYKDRLAVLKSRLETT